jgi:membrane-bound ClpP family serine protease
VTRGDEFGAFANASKEVKLSEQVCLARYRSGPVGSGIPGGIMIILGIILVILGYLLPQLSILVTIGIILIVVGAILALLGGFGRTVGPRRHYW